MDGKLRERVHLCPPDGMFVTPCCGKTPFELPRTDRMTMDPGAVVCIAVIGPEGVALPER